MNTYKIFIFFNKLYQSCFPLYKWLYFSYKFWSDRKKIRTIKNYVKPGMKVIDIGANIGFYSILLSKLVDKKGIVYAFEPDKNNFKFLKKLTSGLGNVKIVNAACGEKSRTANLYKSKGMNIDHQTYNSGEFREKVMIKMVSVDDYLRNIDQNISFVKIDAQGYDCHVFMGMKDTLSSSKNTLIIGELWPYGLKKAGSSVDKYLSEIKIAGFNVKIFSENDSSEYSLYEDNKFFYLDFVAKRMP